MILDFVCIIGEVGHSACVQMMLLIWPYLAYGKIKFNPWENSKYIFL